MISIHSVVLRTKCDNQVPSPPTTHTSSKSHAKFSRSSSLNPFISLYPLSHQERSLRWILFKEIQHLFSPYIVLRGTKIFMIPESSRSLTLLFGRNLRWEDRRSVPPDMGSDCMTSLQVVGSQLLHGAKTFCSDWTQPNIRKKLLIKLKWNQDPHKVQNVLPIRRTNTPKRVG